MKKINNYKKTLSQYFVAIAEAMAEAEAMADAEAMAEGEVEDLVPSLMSLTVSPPADIPKNRKCFRK